VKLVFLGSHLPPADGSMAEQLLTTLATVPAAEPFAGPDQAALEQMLGEMRNGAQSQASHTARGRERATCGYDEYAVSRSATSRDQHIIC
jgi:hypothetical protein